MKPYLYFAAIMASAGLVGCKPNETKVAGQIFVVTRGAENVKLGGVEILLIEKQAASDFLRDKKPAVEAALKFRQQGLDTAEENARRVQAEFDSFTTSGRLPETPEIVEIKAKYAEAIRQHDVLERQFYNLDALQSQATAQGNSARADALLEQEQSVLAQEKEKIAEAEALTEKHKKALALQGEELKDKLEAAKSNVLAARKTFQNSPTAEDYLEDFLPTAIKKTISDADGKFSLACPRNKPFAIFARAQRDVLNETEKYFWLVNAPNDTDAAELFLSNNNLVPADPDGYFVLKPKQKPK